MLAMILGLFWFTLALLALRRPGEESSRERDNPSPKGRRTVFRTISFAVLIACVVSISGWVGLYLNDEMLQSRSLPWIAPLITVQEYGFGKASQMFPCQIEGSDKGCEAHKWLPTFLFANSLFYFPFVLAGVVSFQRSEGVRNIARSVAGLFVRWGIIIAGTGLIALQIMHGLNLDTHDSLYPHPGIGHWHFGVWEVINDITGTVITIAGLSLPFCLYRATHRVPNFTEARTRLAEATFLSATILIALMLGNVY